MMNRKLITTTTVILFLFAIATVAATAITTTQTATAQQNQKPNHIQWAFLVDITNPEGEIETHQIHTETKKGCEEFREITAEQPRVVSVGECFQINLKKL